MYAHVISYCIFIRDDFYAELINSCYTALLSENQGVGNIASKKINQKVTYPSIAINFHNKDKRNAKWNVFIVAWLNLKIGIKFKA